MKKLNPFTGLIIVLGLMFSLVQAPHSFAESFDSIRLDQMPETTSQFLTSPEEDYITTYPSTVIAGTAEEGEKVKIALYTLEDLQYVLQEEISFTVESLGVFSKVIDLEPGSHAVIVSIGDKEEQDKSKVAVRYIVYQKDAHEKIRALLNEVSIQPSEGNIRP